MKLKNIINFATAFSMLLLPVGNVFAENESITKDMDGYSIVYFLNGDSEAVINKIQGDAKEISLPEEIDGHKVTEIDELAFMENEIIESVTIPDTVGTIGEYAFAGCFALKNITIPKSVTSIGTGCFLCCKELETAEIKGSVTKIPESCFSSCTKLKYVDIPFSVTYIGGNAFLGCTSLNDIALHKNVTDFNYFSLGTYYDTRLGNTAYRSDFIIYAEKDSPAEKYANEHSMIFREIKKGDTNSDNVLDSGDASDILAEYSRLSTNNTPKFSAKQKISADIDDNFLIDSSDASEVLKLYAKSQTEK